MEIPTTAELLGSISTGNNGFVESQYPYEYAHRFITSYPETIPTELLHPETSNRLTSPAREVSRILHQWAEQCGVSASELAVVLADAFVSRHFSSAG